MTDPTVTTTPDDLSTDAIIAFAGERTRDNVWLTVSLGPDRPTVSLNVIATDEGIVLDLYPIGYEDGDRGPVASTYAFDGDFGASA